MDSSTVVVTTIVSNLLSIAVSAWTLYQVRLLIGKELSKGAERLEDTVKSRFDFRHLVWVLPVVGIAAVIAAVYALRHFLVGGSHG
jgi:hypothetical protein